MAQLAAKHLRTCIPGLRPPDKAHLQEWLQACLCRGTGHAHGQVREPEFYYSRDQHSSCTLVRTVLLMPSLPAVRKASACFCNVLLMGGAQWPCRSADAPGRRCVKMLLMASDCMS